MKRPSRLVQLLAELRDENEGSSVISDKTSFATVHLSGDPEGIRLNQTECVLLFNDPDTVQQFFEALGDPLNTGIELHNLTVDSDAMLALNEVFSPVDETSS